MSKAEEIKVYIMEKIASSEYKPGERIPTEKEFCDLFDVSRMTVNKAIGELAAQKIVTPKRGFGTLVNAYPMAKELAQLTGFTEDMLNSGMNPVTELISFRSSSKGFDKPKSEMNLDDKTVVYRIERLRSDDTVPVAVDIAYINSKLVPAIDTSRLEGSLYKYLEEEFDIKIAYMKYEISAVTGPGQISERLKLHPSDPLLKQTHVTYTESGESFEYVETYFNPRKYSFSGMSYRNV